MKFIDVLKQVQEEQENGIIDVRKNHQDVKGAMEIQKSITRLSDLGRTRPQTMPVSNPLGNIFK